MQCQFFVFFVKNGCFYQYFTCLIKRWYFLILFLVFSLLGKEDVRVFSVFGHIEVFLRKEFINLSSRITSMLVLIPLFFSIFIINFLSIIPCFFIFTSQVSFILPVAISIWLMGVLYFLFKKTDEFFVHLVPLGSPNGLMFLLVLIELIRNFIRPITISIRLVANITAGHLLLHLLRAFTLKMIFIPIFVLILLFLIIFLVCMELGVALIQRYIFSTLIALYSREIS